MVAPASQPHLLKQTVELFGAASAQDALEVGEVLTAGEVGVEGRAFDDRANAAQGLVASLGGAEQAELPGGVA